MLTSSKKLSSSKIPHVNVSQKAIQCELLHYTLHILKSQPAAATRHTRKLLFNFWAEVLSQLWAQPTGRIQRHQLKNLTSHHFESPSLEIFKTRLDKVLCSLL